MFEAIKYNLAHLLDGSGRDAKPTFWWYILFLVIVQIGAGMLVMAGVGSAMQSAQSGASPEAMQADMMAQMGEMMGTQIWVSAAISAVVMLLLFASFVRRLHDGGFSGYIAIVPFALQAITIAGSIAMIDQMEAIFAAVTNPADMQRLQAEMGVQWQSIAGWVAILVVVAFGVMKSQPGPNRYGEEPAS
jgi:uncharacterized membrane protein YhaH (DUF805 family)